MTISGSTIWEVEQNGSDTLNGGGFYYGATLDTDLAATSATTSSPVVSSASYNFQSGDVGKWLFIKSGTNWTPGWYQIASVASNQATLTAGIGTAFLFLNNVPNGTNASAGCATTGSPTAGSWAIDYSIALSCVSLTGLSGTATTTTIAGSGFTKAMIGNQLSIPSGVTNATTGIYQITAVTAGTSATLDRVWGTGTVSTGWTGGLGGAFASLGMVGSVSTNGNITFQKYSASVYSITSASNNVAGGCFSPVTTHMLTGYNTTRTLVNADTLWPTNQANGISTATLLTVPFWTRNVILDGQSLTSIRGTSGGYLSSMIIKNCTNSATSSPVQCEQVMAQGCTTAPAFNGGSYVLCAAIDCTSQIGFSCTSVNNCVARGCAQGFVCSALMDNCSSYNNTSDGFAANGTGAIFLDCVSWSNGGKGFNNNSKSTVRIFNCAAGGDTGADFDAAVQGTSNTFTLTANPFSNAGATISMLTDVWAAFMLNSIGGGGATCRGASVVPYCDLGAVQHQPSTSVGGTQMMSGGRL